MNGTVQNPFTMLIASSALATVRGGVNLINPSHFIHPSRSFYSDSYRQLSGKQGWNNLLERLSPSSFAFPVCPRDRQRTDQ